MEKLRKVEPSAVKTNTREQVAREQLPKEVMVEILLLVVKVFERSFFWLEVNLFESALGSKCPLQHL